MSEVRDITSVLLLRKRRRPHVRVHDPAVLPSVFTADPQRSTEFQCQFWRAHLR